MYQPATPPSAVPHAGRTALTYGASLGIGMGILQSVLILVLDHTFFFSFSIFLIPLSLLLWVVGFLLAGTFAGKRFGKVSTGTLAGLWAGLIGGAITGIATFVSLMSSMARNYDYDYSYHYLGIMAASYLTMIIFLILLMLGVGTGLGALGGLIGQSFSGTRLAVQAQYHQNDGPRYEQAAYRQTDPIHQEQQRRSGPPQPE